jgi:hypothetical protein
MNAVGCSTANNVNYVIPAFSFKHCFIVARYLNPSTANDPLNPTPPAFNSYNNLLMPSANGALVANQGTNAWYRDGNYLSGFRTGTDGFLYPVDTGGTAHPSKFRIYEMLAPAGWTSTLTVGNVDPVGSPSRAWNGEFSEILVFSAVKTGDARLRILQYLSKISKIPVFTTTFT